MVDFVNVEMATPTSWPPWSGFVTGLGAQIPFTKLLMPCTNSGLAKCTVTVHILQPAPTLNGHGTLGTQKFDDRSLLQSKLPRHHAQPTESQQKQQQTFNTGSATSYYSSFQRVVITVAAGPN